MSIRFWRRLATCIAIDCCFAAAADRPEYRAAAASSAHARALVIEDRRGFRAVFADADFPVTREVSDFVAVQLVKAAGLDRAGIVISGSGPASPEASEIVGAVAEALLNLQAASVSVSKVISVFTEGGACIATFYPARLGGCEEGTATHGRIRAVFQMIDVPHGLATRESAARAYPVQAVAIGNAATVLALGGEPATPKFAAPGRIVVPLATDARATAPETVVEKAAAAVLRRVR